MKTKFIWCMVLLLFVALQNANAQSRIKKNFQKLAAAKAKRDQQTASNRSKITEQKAQQQAEKRTGSGAPLPPAGNSVQGPPPSNRTEGKSPSLASGTASGGR